ncbi:MAG: lipopolysaccharide biosynthesis protein, partial [Clostridia bacterium]|nr:lipopolysaccharide biosynthesis protein [Clostridia bacterium]
LYTVQGVLYVLVTKIAYLSVGFVSAVARPAILMLTGMTGLFTLVFVCLQRKSFEPRLKATLTRPFLSEISRYAAPLIPITVITWLNSSVSQLALRNLLGFEDVGIFTSALGLASSINIIQSGFNTYWAPYVFENYQKDDKRRFFTVHRVMACALTLFGLGITVLQQPVFLLLGKSYRSAVIYFPFLFLSPICYCLSETTGMGINIAKKTYWTTIIFGLSVVANMALCYLLIPVIGAPGAAMATALSAVLSLVLRTVIGEKYYKAISNYRYVGYTIGLMSGASMLNLWLADSPLLKYVLLVLVLALACLLFRKEIGELWTLLRQILSELVRKRGAKEGK